MRIQHNIMAMNSYRNLSMNNSKLSKNLEKLSSGYRINRAGDDAAGLAISEKMRSQIAGLDQAQKNAQSGINLVQTAEGALTEVHDMLNRMVTLATQAANGTYSSNDQAKIQSEITSLTEEINRIAENSNFNGTKLLDGSLANEVTADIKFGTTKLTASAGADAAVAVALQVDATVTPGIAVTVADSGAVTVKLGTKDTASTYSAAEIAEAVRTAAQAKIDAGTGDADINKSLLSFNLEGNDITLNAGDAAAQVPNASGTMAAPGGATTPVGALTLQIGASRAETIDVSIGSMKAAALDIDAASMNVGDVDSANAALDNINTAIERVSATRSNLGAIQNRLEHTINNLGVMEENIQDAEANIRDTDIADEMMAYTKNNILIQSAQAMLAQANQVPQGVLQLMQ